VSAQAGRRRRLPPSGRRSFRPGEGIAGRVFLTAKPLVVNDIQVDNQFVGSQGAHVHSIACLPMLVYNETIGVINVTNKLRGAGFTPEDLNMLKAVADQAAVAVNKAQLWNLAVTDSLTGLFVRRYFMLRLQDEIPRAERYNKALTVIMADLDHFKTVNDTYGHAAGNRLLKIISDYLRKNIREVDVLALRWGRIHLPAPGGGQGSRLYAGGAASCRARPDRLRRRGTADD
jgi:GAF domain-containing protein